MIRRCSGARGGSDESVTHGFFSVWAAGMTDARVGGEDVDKASCPLFAEPWWILTGNYR